MIRVVIENMLLFLLPSLIYVTYVWMTQPETAKGETGQSAGEIMNDAPLLWLFAAGAVLVLLTLIAFGNTSGGRPGQHYEPPTMKDGHIEPGHIQ